MASTVFNTLTAGQTKASANTIVYSSTSVAVDNVILLFVAFDNLTATTPTVTGITKPAGETADWQQINFQDSPVAAAAGGVRGEMWAIKTTVAWSSHVITVTLSAAVVAKLRMGYVLRDIDMDTLVAYKGSAVAASGSISIGARPTNGITIGAIAVESTATGSVTGGIGLGVSSIATTGGSTNTNLAGSLRYSTSGTQTAFGGGSALDQIFMVVQFAPMPVPKPATVLNIGPGVGQLHVRAEYSYYTNPGVYGKTQAELAAGATDTDGFYTDQTQSNDMVSFVAWAGGTPLPGYPYSGSGLREVTADGSADVVFNALVGEHIMQGKTKLSYLNWTDEEVVIAMLSNGNGATVGIGTDMDDAGVTRLRVYRDGAPLLVNLASPYPSTEFEWKIRVIDGTVEIYYQGSPTPSWTASDFVMTDPYQSWFFRVGTYNEYNDVEMSDVDAVPSNSDNSSVLFRDISFSHTFGTDPVGGTDTLKIAIGDTILAFDKLYIGSTKVNRVYVGDVMVYDDA